MKESGAENPLDPHVGEKIPKRPGKTISIADSSKGGKYEKTRRGSRARCTPSPSPAGSFGSSHELYRVKFGGKGDRENAHAIAFLEKK